MLVYNFLKKTDRITSYNVCYTKLLRAYSAVQDNANLKVNNWPELDLPVSENLSEKSEVKTCSCVEHVNGNFPFARPELYIA